MALWRAEIGMRGSWRVARRSSFCDLAAAISPAFRCHWPTRPSIRSRSRSAWPQWRAYSSIMWTSTSRSAMVPPSRIVPRMPRSGEPATKLFREGNLVAPGLPGIVYDRWVGDRAAQSASARSSDQYSGGASACAITRRNQLRSTSAMWRMRPSRDMVEGGTDRRASWAGSRRTFHLHRQPVGAQVVEATLPARPPVSRP